MHPWVLRQEVRTHKSGAVQLLWPLPTPQGTGAAPPWSGQTEILPSLHVKTCIDSHSFRLATKKLSF